MENIISLTEKIINEPYQLSEKQKKAVILNTKNIKIIAGAGAGKTETLARKIIYLILVKKIEPKYIVAFTFTDRAAESLRNRIYNIATYFNAIEILNHLGEMYIGTIHSYSKRILEDYFDYGNYNLLDENQEVAFLLHNKYQLEITEYEKNMTKSILAFHRTANMIYNELINKDTLKKNATDFYIKFNKYNKLLEKHKLMTFGKIIYDLVIKLREDEKKIKEINVKYLFVDEFQDINYLQYSLIKLIGEYSNVTVIGDKRQTIYQWRGSNYKFFDDFNEEFNDVETVIIPENRRSLKNIVINANKFVKSFNDSNYEEMDYINNDDGALVLGRFNHYNDEARNIVETILKLKNNNIIKKYSDIAILMRSIKHSSDCIITEFKNHNIPYIIAGKIGLFKRDEATALGLIFLWFSDEKQWKLENKKFNNEDLLKCVYKIWSNIIVLENYDDFKKAICNIKAKIYLDNTNNSDKYENLTEIFQDVLNVLNYKSLDYQKDQIIMANIGRFNQLLTDYESANWYGGKHSSLKVIIKGLYYYINTYALTSYEEQQIDDLKNLDAVQIMTVHQAKGLEWPIVFLTSISQGIFPISMVGKKLNWCGVPANLFDKKRYEGNLEDEKRLFYVAITRPKNNLIITNYKIKTSKPYNGSEFIDNLALDLFENYNINNNYYFMKDSEKKEELKSFNTTELIKYNQCHYAYLLRNIFGYQPGINEAIGFGNALHFVLRKAADLMKEGYNEASAITEAMDEYFHLPFAGERVLNNFSKSGKNILINFVQEHPNILKNSENLEYRLEYPIENASVIGKVDIVIKDNELGFEIIDYKTDKNVGTYEESFMQINTYAIGLKKLGKNVSKGYVAYLKENELKEVNTNDESQNLSEDEIKAYINSIKSNNFNPTIDNHCNNCDVKKICKYYRV